MARTREEFSRKLHEFMGNDNVYFEPPESIKLVYPCVIYGINSPDVRRADNIAYTITPSYDVTFIMKKPDDQIITRVAEAFSMSRFSRNYTADNLQHYAFTIYY